MQRQERTRFGHAIVLALVLAMTAQAAFAVDDLRCAHYGRGFAYSESTGFCVRLSGSVEADFRSGKGPYRDHEGGSIANGFDGEVKGSIDARKDTDLGPLRIYVAPKGRLDNSLPN